MKAINQMINCAGNLFNAQVIASSGLGYMGGWFVGVGSQVGLLQGLTITLYTNLITQPVNGYITRNTAHPQSDMHDKIQPGPARIAHTINYLASYIIPIAITFYCKDQFTALLHKNTFTSSLLTSLPTRDYTPMTGVFVGIAPFVVQSSISLFRSLKD